MLDITDIAKDETIYLVMSEGDVYLATTDEGYAARTLDRLAQYSKRYAESCTEVTEEECPLAVGSAASKDGDHAYLDKIEDGLFYFEDSKVFTTCEGDELTEMDIESNFGAPSELCEFDFSDDEDEG